MSKSRDVSISISIPASKIDFILKLLYNVCDQEGFSEIEISHTHEDYGNVAVALEWQHIEGVANEEYDYSKLEHMVIDMIAKDKR